MKVLFVHHSFPGEFKFMAASLSRQGHEVVALTYQPVPVTSNGTWEGVKVLTYNLVRQYSSTIQPWLEDFEKKVIHGEACFLVAKQLKDEGFSPDVMIVHPSTGEGLFLKEVWPNAKLGIYCDFFYNVDAKHIDFDPEFQQYSFEDACWIKVRNLNTFLHFEAADAAMCPTQWQYESFPETFQTKTHIIHDGINTQQFAPNPHTSLQFTSGTTGQPVSITRQNEVITFISRNLEPCRGFHTFMRSLPEILEHRPQARIIIVGSNDAESLKPHSDHSKHRTWRDIFSDELSAKIPSDSWHRISFVGTIPYKFFIPVLQLSRIYVHLSYPLVLSWTILEAMSTGCTVVASDTPSVREFMIHNETGRLVDFFSPSAIAKSVCELLDNPQECDRLSKNAQDFVQKNYDLKRVCLPKQIAWLKALASS